ncbi:MAG: hypothetical protein WAK20_15565, partial [Candidatus Acidiferrum sp.]
GQFIANIIVLGTIVFGIRRIARFNMLGWFLVIACSGLLAGALELLAQPNAFYRQQGYFVTIVLGVLLLWPLITWRISPNGEPGTAA